MLRSLFSGVSGLRNNQTRMDVIGNNIANVNTVGFKAGRVEFKEGFAQLMQGATRPPGSSGGINPVQVGLGSEIGSIDTLFSQGNIETTGINTDLAIQGNSFFVLGKGPTERYYSRAGNFQVDANGKLVSPTNGFTVQGRTAVNGVMGTTIGDIQLPFGQATAAKATTNMTLVGNLDASAPDFDKGTATTVDPLDATQRALPQNARSFMDATITAYDSLGTKQDVKIVLYKTGQNQWDWKVNPSTLNITGTVTEVAGTHPISFLPDGTIDKTSFTAPQIQFTPTDGANDVVFTIDPTGGALGTASGLTQFAGANNAVLHDQDGYSSGSLQGYAIDRSGTITGTFSNGTTVALGQIALADFNNPGGLVRTGDNMYAESGNSGNPVVGFALSGAQSEITAGGLEMSNVDLAQEFTNMIIAQRGFQANGRVITTSDQMLQELVQLKQ